MSNWESWRLVSSGINLFKVRSSSSWDVLQIIMGMDIFFFLSISSCEFGKFCTGRNGFRGGETLKSELEIRAQSRFLIWIWKMQNGDVSGEKEVGVPIFCLPLSEWTIFQTNETEELIEHIKRRGCFFSSCDKTLFSFSHIFQGFWRVPKTEIWPWKIKGFSFDFHP